MGWIRGERREEVGKEKESVREEARAKGRIGIVGVCEIWGLVLREGDQQTSIFPRLGLKLVKLRMY